MAQPPNFSTIPNTPIPRIAQYGNTLIGATNNAILRGTGNYNPPPNWEQTTNRGQAYDQSLALYGTSDYYNVDKMYKADSRNNAESQWETVQSNLDQDNKLPYSVGNSGFHPEPTNSWSRPDFEGSRGSDQYQVWAVNSLQMTPTPLLNLFFSKDNVDYLQNRIIEEVYKIRNQKISRQSDDNLLIIMRNKFIYGLSGSLPHSGNIRQPYARGTINNGLNSEGYPKAYSSDGSCTSLEFQISRLNKSVLEDAVSQILSEIGMYQQYIKDASSLPIPLSHPVQTTMKGSRVISENIGLDNSHEMNKAMTSYSQRFNII